MNYKSISTFLILLLIGLLVWVLIKYYSTPIRVSSSISELNQLENNLDTNRDNPISIPSSNSGDFASNIEVTPKENMHTETIISESGEINLKNVETPSTNPFEVSKEERKQTINEKGSQVIITSEDTMTNKEKREILTELDNTLMELLDVVDKVQTVDETRLITDESEVQR